MYPKTGQMCLLFVYQESGIFLELILSRQKNLSIRSAQDKVEYYGEEVEKREKTVSSPGLSWPVAAGSLEP